MKNLFNYFVYVSIIILTALQWLPVEDKYVKVAQEAIEKTVMITVTYNTWDEYGNPCKLPVRGSGVFVTKDGFILTVKHLFTVGGLKYDRAVTIEMSDGSFVAAEIIAISDKSDLALLKEYVVKNVVYAKLVDPRKLQVGQEVIAVGNPRGLTFSVSNGIISGLYRDFPSGYNVTQSNTALNPGNSGGPLFNLQGELVGINSFGLTPIPGVPVFTGLGFSVQSGQCLEFLTFTKSKINPNVKYKWLTSWVAYKNWR